MVVNLFFFLFYYSESSNSFTIYEYIKAELAPITNNQGIEMKLVLAIPHSVRELNEDLWVGSVGIDADRWTDWFTDRVCSTNIDSVVSVIGDVSRYDCDLERLLNDPMEAQGQGILYTRTHFAHRELTEAQITYFMSKWTAYRENLVQELTEGSLLIDCHSFPSDLSDVDICIGYNGDVSQPSADMIDLIKNHFEILGYKVGVNDPYSNSITPKTEVGYKSVMIELNKRIYMDEKTLQESEFSYKVHNALNSLYLKLIEFA